MREVLDYIDKYFNSGNIEPQFRNEYFLDDGRVGNNAFNSLTLEP
jgi:hypothetical protein